MPFSLIGWVPWGEAPGREAPARPMEGKRRGVTKPAGRAKRKNRRKP